MIRPEYLAFMDVNLNSKLNEEEIRVKKFK